MKKLFFSLILILCFSTTEAQNGMFMPRTIDTAYNMYPGDTCKCFIVLIENIGFNNFAASKPMTFTEAFEWVSKGNISYPGSFSILYICESSYNTWSERYKWSENIQFVPTGDF